MFIFNVVAQYFSIIKEDLLLNNVLAGLLYNSTLSKHTSIGKAEILKIIQKSPELFSQTTPSDGRWLT